MAFVTLLVLIKPILATILANLATKLVLLARDLQPTVQAASLLTIFTEALAWQLARTELSAATTPAKIVHPTVRFAPTSIHALFAQEVST